MVSKYLKYWFVLKFADDMITDTSVSVTSFMDVISSDDSESTADHKSRFGKPVNVPNLAENIKGISTCFSWNQIIQYLS